MSPPEDLHLEYDVHPEDYARACYAHLRRGRIDRIARVSAGVLIALVGVYVLWIGEWFGAVALLYGGVIILGSGWLASWRFRRDKKLAMHFTVQFSPAQVLFVSEHGRSELNWSTFVNFAETAEFFLLYRSRLLYNFIPKRCLSVGDQDNLRQVLRSHGIVRRQPGSSAKVILHWAVIITFALLLWFIARTAATS